MEKLTLERVTNMYRERVGQYDLNYTKKDIGETIVHAMGGTGNKAGGTYIPIEVLASDEEQVIRELNDYVSNLGLKIRRNFTYPRELIIVGLNKLRKQVVK